MARKIFHLKSRHRKPDTL